MIGVSILHHDFCHFLVLVGSFWEAF